MEKRVQSQHALRCYRKGVLAFLFSKKGEINMKNTTITMIAVLLAFSLPQFAYGQKVEAPDYKDGEWWVFQSSTTNRASSKNRVTFKNGEFESNGSIPLASANLPAVHLKDSKKKPLNFPLVKGKKWSYRYRWESPRSGREYWRSVDAEVIGPVSVPLKTAAGKFKVIEIRRIDTTTLRSRDAKTKYTYFYSAKTKSIVKIIQDWESSDGSPIHREMELIEFSGGK